MVFKNVQDGKKLPASESTESAALRTNKKVKKLFKKKADKPTKRRKNRRIKISKKQIAVICASLLVLSAIVLGAVWLSVSTSPTQAIEKVGKEYYIEQFYPQVESLGDKKTEFLKKSHDTGIFVSLENLQRFSKRAQDERAQKNLENATKQCDTNKTKVKIRPNDPFSKQDFTVEAVLEGCN